jgi:hypothetical protein
VAVKGFHCFWVVQVGEKRVVLWITVCEKPARAYVLTGLGR